MVVISSETRTVESVTTELITYKRSHYLAIWSLSARTFAKLNDTIGCLFKMSHVWSVAHVRRKTLSDSASQSTHDLYRNDSPECLLVWPVRFGPWTRERSQAWLEEADFLRKNQVKRRCHVSQSYSSLLHYTQTACNLRFSVCQRFVFSFHCRTLFGKYWAGCWFNFISQQCA